MAKTFISKKALILVLLVYVVSAGSFYAAFSYLGNKSQSVVVETPQGQEEEPSPSTLLTINPNEPKDQACPLNGQLFTKIERDAWEKRRPLAVMIENTPDSRPQSGLSKSDLVFEIVAEGGITRFLAFFYCNVQVIDTTLAPIRSARTYYVEYASGFNLPMYVHVGGANLPGPADALGQIADYGWNGENDLNQFSIGYPTFVRDYNRIPGKEIATEHTMVTSTEKLWKVAAQRGWTNLSPDQKIGKKTVAGTDWKDGYKSWKFEDKASDRGSVTSIAYDFWSGYDEYAVKWEFNAAKGAYLRSVGGEAQTDLNNKEQLAAQNVVILLTKEKGPIDEKKHMLYQTTGTGDAMIFKNGNLIEGTWAKKDRQSQIVWKDKKGKEIEFAPGMIWISVLSDTAKVDHN